MKSIKKIIILIIIIILAITPLKVIARSAAEIQSDLDSQSKLKSSIQQSLDDTNANLVTYKNSLLTLQDGLPKIKIEISNIEEEIKKNNLQQGIINSNKKIKELEKQQLEEQELKTLKENYIVWKSEDNNNLFKLLSSDYDFKKAQQFSQIIFNKQEVSVLSVIKNIDEIDRNIVDFNKKVGELTQQNSDLTAQKLQLEDQSGYLNNQINSGASKVLSLQNTIQSVQTNISSLNQEQKAAIQLENQILSKSPNNNGGITHEVPQDLILTKPPISQSTSSSSSNTSTPTQSSASFYFYGLGRDLYQGHGVGLSQYGMKGMGQKGFKAEDIIKFYYQGSVVSSGYENKTINVDGYGSMNLEDYAAGQSEIPSKACGTIDQVNQNSTKYSLYNGNSWSCWPEEAIKAQVIIFRTYGIYHGSVCTSAACQNFNGSQRSRWAVDETKGEVATYNSQPLDAIYASDNSQGFGTANNDTIFQTYSGDGAPYPYLRAVNDDQYDDNPSHWNSWAYKTKSYTINDLNNMINEESNDSAIGGIKSYLVNIKSSLGGFVSSMTFERDPSKRVKKVWFKGSNGSSISLGGYWFKYVWIVWQSNHGGDYLYSQTFFLHEV